MQRHRRNERISCQQRLRRAGKPFSSGAQQILTVPVFQGQNQLATVILVEHRRAPLQPGPGIAHAVITDCRAIRHIARQWNPAGIATHAGDERGIAPTWPAYAKVTLDQHTTDRAARRIDKPDRGLNDGHCHTIFADMTQPLTDPEALAHNRKRARRAPALFLHEQAADEIKDRLAMVKKSFTAPVVITGLAQIWQSSFPDARVIADSDTLSLEQEAQDLVIHAMSLHWANDPVGQMIQARRALKPDGLFLGVLFGGTTLHELRTALAQAEADLTGGLSPRIAPMGEIRDLGGLLQRAGFALPVADSLPLRVTYESPLHLMQDLRAMGEANALSARTRRPMSKALVSRASDIYRSAFGTPDGRVPATFELIFLSGWCPDTSQPQPLRPGSASSRLADALGTTETRLKS